MTIFLRRRFSLLGRGNSQAALCLMQLLQGATRSQRTLRWAHRKHDKGWRPFASGGPAHVAAIVNKNWTWRFREMR